MFKDFPVAKILEELEADNLLPAILFRTARRQCDNDLNFLRTYGKHFWLNQEKQDKIRQTVFEVIEKYKFQSDIILEHEQYESLIKTGVGAHHAGQLLAWRVVLEELMGKSLLKLLIATGTVAAGVDFPARTVIITAHSKRNSAGFNVLSSSEFQQMSGRAGRRGKDTVGICLLAPSPYSDARVLHEVAQKPPEPLKSVYFASPSTVLNLLKFRNVDDLRYTVKRSLASFLDRKGAKTLRTESFSKLSEIDLEHTDEQNKRIQKKANRLEREAVIMENKQITQLEISLEALTKLDYIQESGLTEKGLWAAELFTNLVLEIAEAISSGIFDEVNTVMLVGLVASMSGDSHRAYFNLKANPIPKATFKKLQDVIDHVQGIYKSTHQDPMSIVPDAAITAITWMETETWREFSSLLRLAGIAEGDVARLITQTAENLNQISRLISSHRLLAETAIEARKRLLRSPFSDTFIVE